jgi:hypothetical protein
MSACACTECGAAVEDTAEQCANCGAPIEARRLHEGSDVRIEPERLGAALTVEGSLAVGRWGRVSDHPAAPNQLDAPSADALASVLHVHALKHSDQEPMSALHEATQTVTQPGGEPSAEGKPALYPGQHAPSAELSHLLTHDGAFASDHDVSVPRTAAADARLHATATNTGSHAAQPRRPPVLASEALLRDLAPSRPARRALRIWCPLLGLLGATAAWILTQGQGTGWPLAGAFAGLALLGLPPMPYPGRASAVATVAGTALALVLWTDAGTADGLATILLTSSVVLLAAGLYFRAWHRASVLARFIVSAGVLSGAAFLWMRGDVADLTLFDTAWQSWLPRLVGLGFGILLMLSLLAFMDARSTGGASVWASFVLCWYGVYAAVEILRAAWPKDAAQLDMARIPVDTLLAWTSAPLLTAMLALGLAQLMAAGLAEALSRRSEPFALADHHAPGFRSPPPQRSARGPT